MQSDEQQSDVKYSVVINEEGQYSIWFDDRELPAGWRKVGQTGPKQACLDYITSVWTDMRPLSLGIKMEAANPST